MTLTITLAGGLAESIEFLSKLIQGLTSQNFRSMFV